MPHHPHGKLPDIELDGVDALSSRAFHAFKRVMHLQRRLMLNLMPEHGGHPAQAGCLRVLAHHDGASQAELAESMSVSRPTVTTMLQKMERAGLVTRTADEHDRRITRIHLTDEGRRVLEAQHAVFAKAIEVSLGGLSEGDRRDLDRILSAMADNIVAALGQPASDPDGGDATP